MQVLLAGTQCIERQARPTASFLDANKSLTAQCGFCDAFIVDAILLLDTNDCPIKMVLTLPKARWMYITEVALKIVKRVNESSYVSRLTAFKCSLLT
jgi:hypothetical protein